MQRSFNARFYSSKNDYEDSKSDSKLQELIKNGDFLKSQQNIVSPLDSEYLTDDRSGDEASDSDKEFDSIVDLDQLIKQLSENTIDEKELHQKLYQLVHKIYELRDLIEFDSEAIQDVFCNVIGHELMFYNSYNQIIKIVDLCYQMQVPYQKFWESGVINTLLIYFNEMDTLHQVIPLCYYLSKMGFKELNLDAKNLPDQYKEKAPKLQKTASHKLLMLHIKDYLQENIKWLDEPDSDIIIKFKIASLIKLSQIQGIDQILTKEQTQKLLNNLADHFQDENEGLFYIIQDFNFDQCMDFIELCPDEKLSLNTFELIIALFNENSHKKKFYDGRKPNYQDLNLILSKMKILKDKQGNIINDESWNQIIEVSRFLLQKAIVNTTNQASNVRQKVAQEKNQQSSITSKEEIKENKALITNLDHLKQDMEFIKILKNHRDLNILDKSTAKLLIFELDQQIRKDYPFPEKEQNSAKLALLLYTLRSYDFSESQQFLQQFNELVREKLIPSYAQDDTLELNDYMLLRDISIEIKRHLGSQFEEYLDQQVEALERIIYNYSQLFTI